MREYRDNQHNFIRLADVKNEKLLEITKLNKENLFEVLGREVKLVGYCIPINEYQTKVQIIKTERKNFYGEWYNSSSSKEEERRWFGYILEEYGFVGKSKPTII